MISLRDRAQELVDIIYKETGYPLEHFIDNPPGTLRIKHLIDLFNLNMQLVNVFKGNCLKPLRPDWVEAFVFPREHSKAVQVSTRSWYTKDITMSLSLHLMVSGLYG